MALTFRYTILWVLKKNSTSNATNGRIRKVKQEGAHIYYSGKDINFFKVQSRIKYVIAFQWSYDSFNSKFVKLFFTV